MNELALFAGAGGGILGGYLLGWTTVCAVEYEPYAATVLAARQNDGILPPFPIWDDVRTFDGRSWRGIVDVVSGGFPCQDISIAGKGKGIEGKRSGLWKEMARIISEVRPRYVFVENSPMLVQRGLSTVLSDLAEIGYDAVWTIMGADNVGAPHRRKRIWILAKLGNSNSIGHIHGKSKIDTTKAGKHALGDVTASGENVADAEQVGRGARNTKGMASYSEKWTYGTVHTESSIQRSTWWKSEPDVGRVVNGMASRVDRIKAIGNGQVPRVAAEAFNYLRGIINA